MYVCMCVILLLLLSQLPASESAVCVTDKTKVWVATGELYLQSTASGHGLIGIQGGAQLFAEEFADSLFQRGDSGGAAHDLNCIDVLLLHLWIQEAGDKDDTKQVCLSLFKSHRFTFQCERLL